jgi:plasmid stabilization system protein ParE
LAKVVWTAEAEQWLRRIHDYIARDKPAAAFGIVESLYKRAEILAQFPEIGHAHTTPSVARPAGWSSGRVQEKADSSRSPAAVSSTARCSA